VTRVGKFLALEALIVAGGIIGFALIQSRGKKGEAEGKMGPSRPSTVHSARGNTQTYRSFKRTQEGSDTPVETVPVARRSIDAYILTSCTLEPERQVEVIAKTSGEITTLEVEEGDIVREGTVLARLDEEEAELDLRQAKVRYENLKRSMERSEQTFRQKIISKEEFEDIQAQYEAALVDYDQAKLRKKYSTITSPIDGVVVERRVERGDRVRTEETLFVVADFNPLLAKIHIPEKDLGRIRVGHKAYIAAESVPGKEFIGQVRRISPVVDPASGTAKVTIELPHANQYLRPGMFVSVRIITETHPNALVIPKKALVLESDQSEVFIIRKMGTAYVAKDLTTPLKTEQPVEVVYHASGPKSVAAKIESIAEEADEATGTVEVGLVFDDPLAMPDDASVVGLRVALGDGKKILLRTQGWEGVFRARRVPVKIGFSQGNEVEIVEGLRENDLVIVVGHEELRQGATVRIVNPGATPSPKPATQTPAAKRPKGPSFERLLKNPAIRAEYQRRLKKDPSLASDPVKRREFFRSVMKRRGKWRRPAGAGTRQR